MTTGVHFVQSGTVRVRTTGRPQPAGRPVPLRRLRLLLARRWTEAMPIAAFVVEHPEGRILFDTGEYSASGPGLSTPTRSLPWASRPIRRSSPRLARSRSIG